MDNSMNKFCEPSEIRIGVIEDDEQLLDVVENIFIGHGYKVLPMSSAIGSSSKINRFRPHILIVDLKMPALSGENLLDIFRGTLNRMPKVILYSGIAPEDLEEIAISARADDFVYKGDGIFRLLGRVNLFVQQMKMGGELKD